MYAYLNGKRIASGPQGRQVIADFFEVIKEQGVKIMELTPGTYSLKWPGEGWQMLRTFEKATPYQIHMVATDELMTHAEHCPHCARPTFKHIVLRGIAPEEVAETAFLLNYMHASRPMDGQWWVYDLETKTYMVEATYQATGGPNERCFRPWDWCGKSVLFPHYNLEGVVIPDQLKDRSWLDVVIELVP